MPMTVLIAVGVGVFALTLLGNAFFLWAAARLLKIEGATPLRVAWVTVVVCLVNLAITAAALAVLEWGQNVGLAVGLLAVQFVLFWLCVKRFLHTSFGRGALATVIMLVGGGVCSLLIAHLCRATVAEAFLVPTGAMAPAIYGTHADIVCPNCGMPYGANLFSQWADSPLPQGRLLWAACPNCRQPRQVSPDTRIRTGDRILADKLARPSRWDLIVFRYPENPSVNFVKRLVGLPGETLEIADGDVFVNGQRLKKDPFTAEEMWILVHDTACVARQPLSDGPRWRPGRDAVHWEGAAGRWVFSGPQAGPEALVFSGRLTDELAYNSTDGGVSWQATPAIEDLSAPLVGDVRLTCWLDAFSGDGGLAFRWKFRARRVTATVSAAGEVELVAEDTQGDEHRSTRASECGTLPAPLNTVRTLTFAVRDGQAYVIHERSVVASIPAGATDLKSVKEHTGTPAEACRLELLANRCSLGLSRIVLHKDVYYRNLEQLDGSPLDEPQWGCTGHPITLGADEFFTLGDNSARSKDSRFWGPVRKDALIGVARWRYWPLSRSHWFR